MGATYLILKLSSLFHLFLQYSKLCCVFSVFMFWSFCVNWILKIEILIILLCDWSVEIMELNDWLILTLEMLMLIQHTCQILSHIIHKYHHFHFSTMNYQRWWSLYLKLNRVQYKILGSTFDYFYFIFTYDIKVTFFIWYIDIILPSQGWSEVKVV